MHVLLTLNSFENLTGSEMYVYELARELLSRGHQVTIAACTVGGEITNRITKKGAIVCNINDPNVLLKHYDVIHTAQQNTTRWALDHGLSPIVCTAHSVLAMGALIHDSRHWSRTEDPVVDDRIKHYIAVRPEIQAKLIVADEIPVTKTSVIYNPVDTLRFAGIPQPQCNDSLLFCGTIDNIRKATILYLLSNDGVLAKRSIILVGDKPTATYDGYIEELPEWAEWHPSTWNIEEHLAKCWATASVFVGRTAVEGWLAGRPCRVFNVDEKGAILDNHWQNPPAWLPLFDSTIVTDQILDVYERAINS